MACDGPQNSYFDYDCYYRLKDYFDNVYLTESGEKLLKTYQELSRKNKNLFSVYKDLFVDLTKRLGGDSLFYSFGFGICCKYINYWLNELLRSSKYSEINESDMQFFRVFVDEYATIANYGKPNKKNSCENHIQYLHGKKYARTSILYLIYSLYKQIKSYPINYYNKQKICDNFSLIVRNYKHLIKEHQGDVYLNNRLEYFKKKVIKESKEYNTLCTIDLSKSFPEPIISTTHLRYYAKHKPILLAQVAPKIDNLRVLPSQIETRTQNQQKLLEKIKRIPELEQKIEKILEQQAEEQIKQQEQQQIEQELDETVGQEIDEKLGKELEQTLITKFQELLPTGSVEELGEDQPSELFKGSHSSETEYEPLHTQQYRENNYEGGITAKEQQSPSVNDGKSLLSNVQDTLSGLINDVQPAPILGVSGGMGVLFLLFKYTPVGTIFRGRNGRLQIPSSFRGEYPIGFAGFSEYDDANFGNERYHIFYRAE